MRLAIPIIFLSFFSCGTAGFEKGFELGEEIPYRLSEPEKTIYLGFELDEISGLSWFEEQTLACVQDEEGIIYLFDLKEESVERRISFKQSGDFEGIERVNDDVFVTKSNGTLYRVPIGKEDRVDAEELKTPLKSENNIEGLGFDPATKNLLLGTKGNGYLGKDEKKGKSIFGYDAIGNHFFEKPMVRLKKKDLNEMLEKNDKEKLKNGIGISGVAIHPLSNSLYLISSEGRFLVVLNSEGEISSFIDLPRKHFKQPEGICFSPDGTMYISNEARGGTANILVFPMKE